MPRAIPELISRFTSLPSSGIGALFVLLLYALQSEIRFGSRARTFRTGAADRNSSLAVSLSAAVPVLGFVLAMKSGSADVMWVPHWFRTSAMPGLPAVAWTALFWPSSASRCAFGPFSLSASDTRERCSSKTSTTSSGVDLTDGFATPVTLARCSV